VRSIIKEINMFNKKVMTGFAVLAITASLLGWYTQPQLLAAQLHFSQGVFAVKSIELQAEHTLVRLEIPEEYAQQNVFSYRPCPYNEDSLWLFQPQDFLELAFYINDQEVARTVCDANWTVSREVNVLLTLPSDGAN
jgi:hypothetical protein